MLLTTTSALDDAQRRALLSLARDAIAAHLGAAALHKVAVTALDDRRAGAFVTLHVAGELRGCIGHVEANEPLHAVVARCAVAAAATDPRFPPVSGAELSGLDIEISILGPLEPVPHISEVEIGRHGLVVEQGWHRGLLLPQVATEWGWDAPSFAAHTCIKAGLPRDAWQQGAALFKFEAEVFGERTLSQE
jgi:uncharacterized protein